VTSYTIDNRPYLGCGPAGVHAVDREAKVARAIAISHEEPEVFPLVNNYDPTKGNVVLPEMGSFFQAIRRGQTLSARFTRSWRRTRRIAEFRSIWRRFRRSGAAGVQGAD
jgi:hypothetical protein